MNVGFMSGSVLLVATAHATISAAAIMYMARQPSASPTSPLTTREASMPVSRPEITSPTLRPLFSGSENCDAIGTNICGTIEHAPVTSDAAHTVYMSRPKAMAMSDIINKVKFISVIFFRWYRSPSGMMNSRPRA